MTNAKTRTCWLIYRARRRWWRRPYPEDYKFIGAVWSYDRTTALGWAVRHHQHGDDAWLIDVRDIPIADPPLHPSMHAGLQATNFPFGDLLSSKVQC